MECLHLNGSVNRVSERGALGSEIGVVELVGLVDKFGKEEVCWTVQATGESGVVLLGCVVREIVER